MSMNWLCKFFMEGGASACRNGEKVCRLSARACVWVGCLSLCYNQRGARKDQQGGRAKDTARESKERLRRLFLALCVRLPPPPGSERAKKRKRERERERDHMCTCCFCVRV